MQALCTIRRAAELLRISRQRVDQLVAAGRLSLVPVEVGEGEAAPRLIYTAAVLEFSRLPREHGRPLSRQIVTSHIVESVHLAENHKM